MSQVGIATTVFCSLMGFFSAFYCIFSCAEKYRSSYEQQYTTEVTSNTVAVGLTVITEANKEVGIES